MEGAMFQRVMSAYRRFVPVLAPTIRPRCTAVLGVLALEERATPASLLAPIDAPEVAAVADLAPNPTTFEEADQPIVRLDLMPAGSSLKSDAGQEGEDAL